MPNAIPREPNMNEKTPSSSYESPAISDFLQFFSASPLADIQRRNIQALTASASKISDAIATVASKQMAAASSLASARPREPVSTPGGLPEFFAAQLHSGREAMEMAITEMRVASDVLRNCWYDVASEFEACARDNLHRVEEQLKQSGSTEHRVKAGTMPAQRAKAAAAE
jgi:hypothetical protein